MLVCIGYFFMNKCLFGNGGREGNLGNDMILRRCVYFHASQMLLKIN